MEWEYKKDGPWNIPNIEIKHKCPICKCNRIFRRVDVTCSKNTVYCEGYNIPLYRCDNCMVILAIGKPLCEENTGENKDDN